MQAARHYFFCSPRSWPPHWPRSFSLAMTAASSRNRSTSSAPTYPPTSGPSSRSPTSPVGVNTTKSGQCSAVVGPSPQKMQTRFGLGKVLGKVGARPGEPRS